MNKQIEALLDQLASAIIDAVRAERGYVDDIAVDAYIDQLNVEDEVKDRAHDLLNN